MESFDLTNPTEAIWRNNFAFGYWHNRIEKLNPYNHYDAMDALYLFSQLADLYTHLFAVNARNPEQPWIMMKEDTYGGDIRDVLDALTVSTADGDVVSVTKLLKSPDDLVDFKQVIDDVQATDVEKIAREFLGCSASLNRETGELDFFEEPKLHVMAANATLNFYRGFRPLLNDMKHGFRIIPVSPTDIRDLFDEGLFGELDAETEELTAEMQEFQSDKWGFCFLRLHTEPHGNRVYDGQLNLYHADAETCKHMAEVVVNLIYNLIQGRGGGQTIAEPMAKAMEATESADPSTFKTLHHLKTLDFVSEKPT